MTERGRRWRDRRVTGRCLRRQEVELSRGRLRQRGRCMSSSCRAHLWLMRGHVAGPESGCYGTDVSASSASPHPPTWMFMRSPPQLCRPPSINTPALFRYACATLPRADGTATHARAIRVLYHPTHPAAFFHPLRASRLSFMRVAHCGPHERYGATPRVRLALDLLLQSLPTSCEDATMQSGPCLYTPEACPSGRIVALSLHQGCTWMGMPPNEAADLICRGAWMACGSAQLAMGDVLAGAGLCLPGRMHGSARSARTVYADVLWMQRKVAMPTSVILVSSSPSEMDFVPPK
ncbi:hypothetical protein DFH09DRAFT_324795 [Mycena vulgaris]|nr:hypothetical protein DFH09DRAFT_324795 [Mycena vulgaris]